MADILGINILYLLLIPIIIIAGLFFLSGLVYISRYEVGIKTRKNVWSKDAPGKNHCLQWRDRDSGRYFNAWSLLVQSNNMEN